jgi:hypothetical protein
MSKRTCGRGPEGSGYVKPKDPVNAASLESAYKDALAARTMYDNIWSTETYNPDGSNAQLGWPSEQVKEDEKQDAWIDPTEFTGVTDTDIRYVSVEYPVEVEVFDVSGNKVKIHEPIAFDEEEFDAIELLE